jgi:hypothetical protein
MEEDQKREEAKELAVIKRPTFLTAYTIKSSDPRDQFRVKNLQLLCFKLGTHKLKIQKLLDKYTDPVTKVISLGKVTTLLKDLSLIMGLLIQSYSQY